VEWAVTELARAAEAGSFESLKVRSGEHLALLLCTALLVTMPKEVDVNGGVDLSFDLRDNRFPVLTRKSARAAFEVKSLPGPFREAEARMQLGDSFSCQVESAASIFERATPILERAYWSLQRKAGPDILYNVFLIVHPFDGFAVELPRVVMANALPSPSPALDGLDSIWVLWIPEHLTIWSRESRDWTQVFYTCIDPETDQSEVQGLSALQDLEDDLLDRCGFEGASPYLFHLTSERTDESSRRP
jgi:hypothetical protein